MTELREGDIYRWSYKEPGDNGAWGRYHCCSRIAIVRSGLLRDTYWSSGSEGRTFGPDDLYRLELTFVANQADLQNTSESWADYYDEADIVDLNHSNSSRGNFYLRKGAKRSAARMLKVARGELLREQDNQRLASRRASDLRDVIAAIESGDTGVYI